MKKGPAKMKKAPAKMMKKSPAKRKPVELMNALKEKYGEASAAAGKMKKESMAMMKKICCYDEESICNKNENEVCY